MRTVSAIAITAAIVAVVAARVTHSQSAPNHTVSQEQMDKWKTELSNWGRWGKDDQKGTINLITPAKRKAAAALVKEGFAVSLARDADTVKSIDNPQPYEDVMTNVSATGSGDKISVSFHGYAHTHFDGLAHHFLNGQMYNGYPHDNVTMQGMAQKNAVINDKDGIFTRGILMDIPRLKGVPYLEPGTPIYQEDLEAWEKKAGIRVQSGDAVFIRTGRWTRRAQTGPWDVGKLAAGLDPSVLPWIKQRDIALLGSESALSAVPIPKTITNGDDYLPVHNFVLVAFGMNLFDDCDLDKLAETAAARNRWEFLLVASPLPMPKGTGSPINPIAIF
jgi:kynurenine formamidase